MNKPICRALLYRAKYFEWADIYNLASLTALEISFIFDSNKSNFLTFWLLRFKSKIRDELLKLKREKRDSESFTPYKSDCYTTLDNFNNLQNLIKEIEEKNILTEKQKQAFYFHIGNFFHDGIKNKRAKRNAFVKENKTTNVNLWSLVRNANDRIREHCNLQDYITDNNFEFIELYNTNK